jgi:23S rRNA (cytosine1962-C5)-methyltransferase
MLYITPGSWAQYQLIDSGNFEKIERFGKVTTIRPEPQAIWSPSMERKEWSAMADYEFRNTSSQSGEWDKLRPAPDSWQMPYPKLGLSCQLKLTAFKHVGIFPEQAANWDYITEKISGNKDIKFLNLFAYTGLASVAAQKAGASATHVDSVKQVVSWARDNMEASKAAGIRWIVEDVRKFVSRELNRGNKYEAIILDPPAFGRGAKGESWKLEKDLRPLLEDVAKLLGKERHFFLLNTYSLGFSAMILENLVNDIFGNFSAKKEIGELYLSDNYGKKLPLGVFARFCNF